MRCRWLNYARPDIRTTWQRSGLTLESDPFNPADMRGRALTRYAMVREEDGRWAEMLWCHFEEKGLSIQPTAFKSNWLGSEEMNPMLQCCQFYSQWLLWCNYIHVMLVMLVTRWGQDRNGSVGSDWQRKNKNEFLQDATCWRRWSLEPQDRSDDPQTCSTFDQTTVWSESCSPPPRTHHTHTYTHQSSSTAKRLTRSMAASTLRHQFSYTSGSIVSELAES